MKSSNIIIIILVILLIGSIVYEINLNKKLIEQTKEKERYQEASIKLCEFVNTSIELINQYSGDNQKPLDCEVFK